MMGDYANDRLRRYMRQGMRVNSNYVPKVRPKCCCVICQKEVEASEGIHMHNKAVHNIKPNIYVPRM